MGVVILSRRKALIANAILTFVYGAAYILFPDNLCALFLRASLHQQARVCFYFAGGLHILVAVLMYQIAEYASIKIKNTTLNASSAFMLYCVAIIYLHQGMYIDGALQRTAITNGIFILMNSLVSRN